MRALIFIVLMSFIISGVKAAPGCDEYLFDSNVVVRHLNATACGVSCPTSRASTSLWKNPLFVAGAAATFLVVLDKAVPAVYRKLKEKCDCCRGGPYWDRDQDITEFIPPSVMDVGTLRTDIMRIDALLRAQDFQPNVLAYIKWGWLSDPVTFLGYRYQHPDGRWIDLTFNPTQQEPSLRIPRATRPIMVEPTVTTILSDYTNSWYNYTLNLLNSNVPRYFEIPREEFRQNLAHNDVFHRLSDGHGELQGIELENYFRLENPIRSYLFRDITTNLKHLVFSLRQETGRGEPSVMLTFY